MQDDHWLSWLTPSFDKKIDTFVHFPRHERDIRVALSHKQLAISDEASIRDSLVRSILDDLQHSLSIGFDLDGVGTTIFYQYKVPVDCPSLSFPEAISQRSL